MEKNSDKTLIRKVYKGTKHEYGIFIMKLYKKIICTLFAVLIGATLFALEVGDEAYIEVEINGEEINRWGVFFSVEEFDAKGKSIYKKDSTGEFRYEYDANGKLIYEKNKNGEFRYEYNEHDD